MAVSVLGLLLLLVAVITIGAFIASRRRPNVTDPSCGKCTYNVRGLTTFTCPECGSDLREVGIVTPKRESPGAALVMNIVGWTMIFVLVTCLGSSAVATVLGSRFLGLSHDVKDSLVFLILVLEIAVWVGGIACMARDYLRQRRDPQ